MITEQIGRVCQVPLNAIVRAFVWSGITPNILTFVGFVINGLIPQAWITGLFGIGNLYSVPLAATLGLPFYINAEASLPLIRGLLDSGMSQDVALAFLIAGAGTSIGAISGALTIARWRVVALIIVVLWIGAIASGYAFDFLLALKLF